MSTVTPAATNLIQTGGAFDTSPAYSGTFIPVLWSAKLNAKFYATSVWGEIANTDYEGEISGMGDRLVINNVPDITITDYKIDSASLNYEVPTPSVVELVIDQGKAFAFQLNDVLAHQSKPQLMETFSNDAAAQMRVAIDSTILFNTYNQAHANNVGATAGKNTGAYNLGTDAAPVDVSVTDAALNAILAMASVLDEQNVPDDGRWCVIDPATRLALMKSKLAEAQITGDAQSILRNGRIGRLDRFDLYVSNLLPRTVTSGGSTVWQSGDGTETRTSGATAAGVRILMAGHRSGITFASQIVKTESLRNPNNFGDLVRGLQVYGYKVVKPESLTYAVVSGA